jgi:mitogen-activated protein kinase organizer 1
MAAGPAIPAKMVFTVEKPPDEDTIMGGTEHKTGYDKKDKRKNKNAYDKDYKDEKGYSYTKTGKMKKKPDSEMDVKLAHTAPYPTQEHCTLTGQHTGPVLCVRWNRDGDYCITGGSDKSIHLWNPHKGTHVKAYVGVHGYDVLDVSITDDSTRFASSGGDKTVFVWDVTSAQVVRRQRGHTERVNTLAWNKEATVLCSGSYDKTVKLWDLRGNTRDPIQTLSEFNDSVSTVTLNSEQSQIIAGSVDGKIRQYDMRMGTLVTDHVCQPITSLSLSKDENCILVSCLDATLRLFDRHTGELLSQYTGHANTDYKIESCLTNLDAHIVRACHLQSLKKATHSKYRIDSM